MTTETSTSYKIVSWNIANAVGDEVSPSRFGLRIQRQIAFLKSLNADIIMLQEVRLCANADKTGMLKPLDIAYQFAKGLDMEMVKETINPTELSFTRLTLYNPRILWHFKTDAIRTYDASCVDYTFDKDFGRLMMFDRFAPYDAAAKTIYGTRSFCVCNLHFPLRSDEKFQYAELLGATISRLRATDHVPILLAGDCNVFMEIDGAAQLQKIKECGKLREHTGHIDATFVSFPWDKIQARSHLDYVFTTEDSADRLAIQDVAAVDFSHDQISDHFPLIITAKLAK